MSIEYVDLVDYIAIASEVTGFDVDTVMRVAKLDLADSALHPLPDGNKRVAWVALRLFVELNGWAWQPTPGIDDAERAVLAIASGDWGQEEMAVWLRVHLAAPTPS